MVRTEYDYAAFPHHFKKSFFYKKAKIKGGLGWITYIGKELSHFLMGTIFLVRYQ